MKTVAFPLLVVILSGDGMGTCTELFKSCQGAFGEPSLLFFSTSLQLCHLGCNGTSCGLGWSLNCSCSPHPPPLTPMCAGSRGRRNPQGSWRGLLHEEAEDKPRTSQPHGACKSLPFSTLRDPTCRVLTTALSRVKTKAL